MKTGGNLLNAKPLLLSGSLLSWDQTCACTDSGALTCSNKTCFSSRVDLATAGCLGSLPGKKKKNKKRGSCCTEKTPRPNVRFSISEPDQNEYQTCCDLQGNTQGAQPCSSSGFPDRAREVCKAVLSSFGQAELEGGSQSDPNPEPRAEGHRAGTFPVPSTAGFHW